MFGGNNKLNCMLKGSSISYHFLILGGVLLTTIIYFSCGSTNKEVVKPEKELTISKSSQDSALVEEKRHIVDIEFNFAYQYYSHKDFREAIPHFWKAIENDKELRFPGMYYQLGQCYIEIEELDSALMAYEIGADKIPDNLYIRERLEWLYEAKFEYDKAIAETKKILELGGDKSYYFIKLKDLYLRNDQIQKAIEVY